MSLSLAAVDRQQLATDYRATRAQTLALCEPLAPEDMVVQTMPEVSPTKWHLAHVTWFFETMVVARFAIDYEPFDRRFHALFNSYYQALGRPFPRAQRGNLSRPTVAEIFAYREHVDDAMERLLEGAEAADLGAITEIVTLGLHHEQQHQELLLMDILHVLASNPLQPAYDAEPPTEPTSPPAEWFESRVMNATVGHAGTGFRYDNEVPRHSVQLQPYAICNRLVTNGEFARFIADDGYRRPELWLADGWEWLHEQSVEAPLYWHRDADEAWLETTLHGQHALRPDAPVCHVSFYEADAFARWSECRLPTEFEWEHAAAQGALAQASGEVWQWTASPYSAYPGYRPFAGALGEYNGKFMANQFVLRGGCHATPRGHARRTYRNFYYPQQRWMFAGLRLARDI